jgi:hypothetical protein
MNGSGRLRRVASAGPRRATVSANLISERALASDRAGTRSTTSFNVQGAGVMPVSLNSTGRLSRCPSMYAFTPLANAVKIWRACGW